MAANFLLKSIITDILVGLGLALIIIGGFTFLDLDKRTVFTQENIMNTSGGKSATSLTYSPDQFMLDYPQLVVQSSPRIEEENSSAEKLPEEVNINIEKGMSTTKVAQLLSQKGLVKTEKFMKLVKMFDLEKRIKAGNYTFTEDSEVMDVFLEIIIK